MTSDELRVATTIAKAGAVIELLWAHLYDTEMSYHNDDGAQGYMGGTIQTVLSQLDGLLNDLVEREPVLDEPHNERPPTPSGTKWATPSPGSISPTPSTS